MMKRSSGLQVTVLLVLVGAFVFAVASLTAQAVASSPNTGVSSKEVPPQPAWIGPDGKILKDTLPECFKQLDKDGKVKKQKDGKDVCIPSEQLFAPPPPFSQ
jgi:hypothetical protein